jgi:cell division protein FtsQ
MRRKGILLLILVFLWMLVSGFCFLKKAPFFSLKEITVKGNKTVSDEEIVKLGKIKLGRNINTLNLKRVQMRLLQDGRIKKVSLARKFPNRVLIEIEEPKPVFLVNLDYLYGLTDKGEVLLLKDSSSCLGVPLVTGFSLSSFRLNRKLKDQKIAKLLELYKALRKLNPHFFELLSEIDVSDPNNFVLFLVSSGTKILLGMGDYEKKLKRFFQIYGKENIWENLESIDLRFQGEVFLKAKES